MGTRTPVQLQKLTAALHKTIASILRTPSLPKRSLLSALLTRYNTLITITMDPQLVTLTDIHKLEERYPFSEEELEILIRCQERLKNDKDKDDFLLKLALASPYSHFFLPGNEMRDRVVWIENHILPAGFANELRAAISADAFVEYANQGKDKGLERFLEGIADTGRRGTREALRVVYNLVGGEYARAEDIIDVCFRLAVASDALTVPNLNKHQALALLDRIEPTKESIAQLLARAADLGDSLSLNQFIAWAESLFPLLSAPLSTFVHNLVFHGHAYPDGRIPYFGPKLDHASDIFEDSSSPYLLALSMTTPYFGGKWHRLYSSEMDGRSFNRLEWSLLGYAGPTILTIKATDGTILGAFTTETWKESKDFYGNRDCFLFQVHPEVRVHRAVGKDENFMYMHSKDYHSPLEEESSLLPHGLGFGGCLEKPRLFIPETFEHCTADFLDRTFSSGNLLPANALERFEIQSLEVWGVGGDEVITSALRHRAEYREIHDTVIQRARQVHDKTFLAQDMQSGLILTDIFKHQDETRGRKEFLVDDKHGGYKLEH